MSTHFEHFSFSRRWLIASVASFFVLRFFGGIHDAAMILESLGTFMAFGGAAIYFYAEWNKYYFAEGFNRFYRHIAAN